MEDILVLSVDLLVGWAVAVPRLLSRHRPSKLPLDHERVSVTTEHTQSTTLRCPRRAVTSREAFLLATDSSSGGSCL